MVFGTVITEKTTDGVRFCVDVNDKEVWSETKTGHILSGPNSAQDSIMPDNDAYSDHRIDLSEYAGKAIDLTLKVNALRDNSYDWATWLEPMIIIENEP